MTTSLQRTSTSRPYSAGDVTGMLMARKEAEKLARDEIDAERNAVIDSLPKLVEGYEREIRTLRERVSVLEKQQETLFETAHTHPELAEDEVQHD